MRYSDRLVPHEHILFADFETYWSAEYTLKKLNTSGYVRDPRFKAHMLGVQLDDGSPDVIEGKDIPKYLKGIKWNKTATCFHNAPFDNLILSHHYGVVPAYFYDTLAIARVLHGADMRADLATAANHYNVGNKLEDVLIKSKGILDLHSVPGLYDETAVYCGVDVNVMYKMFLKMLAGAKETGLNGKPFPVDELDLIHITTRMFADPILRMDVKQLKQVRDDEIARKKALFYKALSPEQIDEAKTEMLKDKKAIKEGKNPDNIFDLAKWVLGKDRYFVPMLEAMGVEAPMKWSEKQQKMIYATAKGDLEPVIEDLEAQITQVQMSGDNDEAAAAEDAVALIEAKLATSSNIDITRAERFIALGEKGMAAPAGYNYGAAHTFRWGGSNKTNMQNLRRGSKLRTAIMAPPNHVCLVRDSSQIEARVIAKLALCDWRLDAFRSKIDLYLRAAAGIYHLDFASMSKTTHEAERQIGKVAELALGFGGAAGAFSSMAKNYNVVLPDDEVRKIVQNWRKDNPEIVALWADLSWMLAMMALRRKGEFDILKFEGSRDGGRILMPNGLYLKYPNLTGEIIPESRNKPMGIKNASFTYKGQHKYIYGGSCLGANTLVFTSGGLTRIADITEDMTLWDGYEWVKHEGVAYKGIKEIGIWLGLDITEDHMILAGETWKCAMDMDECASLEALSLGQSSAPTWYRQPGSATTLERCVAALLASTYWTSRHVPCSASPTVHARLVKQVKNLPRVLRYLATRLSQVCGRIVTQASSVVARILNAPPTQTTVAEELGCTCLGSSPEPLSSSTQKPSKAGTNSGPISTASTMKETTPQETFASSQGKTTRETNVTRCGLLTPRNNTQPKTSGSSSALLGGTQPSCITSAKVEQGQTSWTAIGQQPVFDVINAGPRNRFMVLTTAGPVIVHNCTENIVQCLARIVVGEQILAVERNKDFRRMQYHRLAMMTHDEGNFIVHRSVAKEMESLVAEKFDTPPSWWPDLPVSSDGGYAIRYEK